MTVWNQVFLCLSCILTLNGKFSNTNRIIIEYEGSKMTGILLVYKKRIHTCFHNIMKYCTYCQTELGSDFY